MILRLLLECEGKGVFESNPLISWQNHLVLRCLTWDWAVCVLHVGASMMVCLLSVSLSLCSILEGSGLPSTLLICHLRCSRPLPEDITIAFPFLFLVLVWIFTEREPGIKFEKLSAWEVIPGNTSRGVGKGKEPIRRLLSRTFPLWTTTGTSPHRATPRDAAGRTLRVVLPKG